MSVMRSRLCLFVLLVAGAAVLHAQDSGWEARMEARSKELVARNGQGTDEVLRAKLIAMAAEDQKARGFVHGQAADKEKGVDASPELEKIDAKETAELKKIVAEHGWPTIHLVGLQASQAAALILIHSPDNAWQRSLLPQLDQLTREDKIDGSMIALVIDKELTAAGKPQRYGTQFKFVDGQAMMFAVEDPAHLDERREKAMLPPMSLYKKMLSDMYHVQVADTIIRPSAVKN